MIMTYKYACGIRSMRKTHGSNNIHNKVFPYLGKIKYTVISHYKKNYILNQCISKNQSIKYRLYSTRKY